MLCQLLKQKPMKKFQTKKLFFKKYVYKVTCFLKNVWRVQYDLEKSKAHLDSYRGTDPQLWWNLEDFKLKYDVITEKFNSDDLKLRFEGSVVNFYCNDEKILNFIVNTLSPHVESVHEPASDSEKEFLLNNTNRKIVCKNYPKGRYQYKIYLRTYIDGDERRKLLEWLDQYDSTKTNISGSSREWLSGKWTAYWNGFFYVSDSPMLSMTMLRFGSYIKYIEEFILQTDINT